MISDDTLMGTSLMTFPAQGTGWFGPGDFTAVKQKGPGYPVCSNHQSLFLFSISNGSRQASRQFQPIWCSYRWTFSRHVRGGYHANAQDYQER